MEKQSKDVNFITKLDNEIRNTKISNTISILILFLCVVFSLISAYNVYTLKKNIKEKNIIIGRLQTNNKILNTYINGEFKDSLNYSLLKNYKPAIDSNGKLLSYEKLSIKYDSLKFASIENNAKINFHDKEIKLLNLEISNLNKLIANKDIELKIEKLNNSILKKQLNYIEKRYGIRFEKNSNKIKFNKTDSAIIVYSYFKNKLYYDTDKKRWILNN